MVNSEDMSNSSYLRYLPSWYKLSVDKNSVDINEYIHYF